VARSSEDVPDLSVSADEVTSAMWRKSMRSIANGQCVEIAQLADGSLAMRDSTDMHGPVMRFTPPAFRVFLDGIKDQRLK
jgi:hypothetical protein